MPERFSDPIGLMSLIGKKSAVVSLGSSCQTTFQIHLSNELLSEALGEELAPLRLPFDWTFTSPALATAWLESGVCFPSSPDALSSVAGKAGAFLWRERGIYFWHDFKTPDGVDVVGTFERTRALYERHFQDLRGLGTVENVIAIVANTQNNLEDVAPDPSWLLYRRHEIARLKSAFEAAIGRPCRMLCVTYQDRRAPGFLSDPARDITVKWIPRDASPWHGSRAFWRTTLRDYFA
jgi:hypothetical protein